MFGGCSVSETNVAYRIVDARVMGDDWFDWSLTHTQPALRCFVSIHTRTYNWTGTIIGIPEYFNSNSDSGFVCRSWFDSFDSQHNSDNKYILWPSRTEDRYLLQILRPRITADLITFSASPTQMTRELQEIDEKECQNMAREWQKKVAHNLY